MSGPRRIVLAGLMALVLFAPSPTAGQTVALGPGEELGDGRTGWVPYAFATESLGTGIGAAAFSSARFKQPASSFGVAAFTTSNDSWTVAGALNTFRVPGTRRLFFDTYLLLSHLTDRRFYVDLDQDPSQDKAGSNDSDPDDFVTGRSDNAQFDFVLRYILPIGNAAEDPLLVYRLNRGLLETGPPGGREWNPRTSGRTMMSAGLFQRYQDLDRETRSNLLVSRSNGLELSLEYDNTDFPRNPARGSRQKLTLTHDFGWFDSSNSWTHLEADLSKYFDLGTSGWFGQQVLALDFWTSNTPTWTTDENNPQRVSHRPPPYMGSTLGGYDRLRAYPSGRFNDKSAVYYTAELRLLPRTRPLRDYRLLDYFEVDWIQVVPFVEAGRVGPEYDSGLYFDDLKVTAGIDLRLMAFHSVFRVGWAWSEEGNQVWAMYAQPFAR